MATSGNIIDIDVYGKDNADGTAVQYIDSKAVANALKMFLTSKRGDYLYAPSSGGILDTPVFRTMTKESLTMLQFNIRNAITNYFTPYINIISINLTARYDEHALEINVIYSDVNRNVEQTTVYVNADFHTKKYDYTDVDYEGLNLLHFCQLKKSDMQGKYLELEPNTEIWTWGSLRFINLTDEDEYFEDILLICNS